MAAPFLALWHDTRVTGLPILFPSPRSSVAFHETALQLHDTTSLRCVGAFDTVPNKQE